MPAKFAIPVAVVLLVFAGIPIASADESPVPIIPDKGVGGKIRVRMICGHLATDARMALLAQFPEVQDVQAFGNDGFTDAGLAHLKQLPKLESLALGSRGITADGLSHLHGSTTLRSLVLCEMRLTEQAAEQISGIPNLESLRFRGSFIEPGVWPLLARMPKLRELHVANNDGSLTDTDVAGLTMFTRLQALSIEGSGFTSAALTGITGNSGLRKLTLRGFPLTDVGAAELASLKHLESLSLVATTVTVEGLKILATLPNLESLQVHGDTVTDADVPVFGGFTRLRTLDMSSVLITEPTTHTLRAALPNTLVNVYRWKHTVEDLKAMSKAIELDSSRQVVGVNMSCLKWATDEKLRIVDDFPTIVRLRAFGGDDLTDNGMQYIKNLPNLADLEIKSNAVTDAGLMQLRKMTSLRTLQLKAPAVTDLGVAELQRELPNCRISR